MKTIITTAHEEEYSNGSKTLGILLNLDMNGKRIDSLIYIYHKEIYIFFHTIMTMNEYLLYGDGKLKRAYISWDALEKIANKNATEFFSLKFRSVK
jgi:hypothetical protein